MRFAIENRRDFGSTQAVLGRAAAPVLAELLEVDVLLAVARVERGDLGSPEAARSALDGMVVGPAITGL